MKKMICLVGLFMATSIFILCQYEATSKVYDHTVQLEIVSETPYMIDAGKLYCYQGGNKWKNVSNNNDIKLILGGDELSLFYADGIYYYDISNESVDEEKPSAASDYSSHMIRELIKLNKDVPFSYVTNGTPAFIALLNDGTILYPHNENYERYSMEEKPIYICGNFILTESGNVYYLMLDIQKGIDEVVCIYNGGDVMGIDADGSTLQCLGLTEKGKAIAWDISNPYELLPIEEWDDLVTVSQGYNFAVALTKDGNVLYASFDKKESDEVKDELSKWNDIVQITVYNSSIYGLKANGECVSFHSTFPQE